MNQVWSTVLASAEATRSVPSSDTSGCRSMRSPGNSFSAPAASRDVADCVVSSWATLCIGVLLHVVGDALLLCGAERQPVGREQLDVWFGRPTRESHESEPDHGGQSCSFHPSLLQAFDSPNKNAQP